MGAERINAVKTSFFGKGALSLLPAELKKMGIRRGLIVTLGRSERIPVSSAGGAPRAAALALSL